MNENAQNKATVDLTGLDTEVIEAGQIEDWMGAMFSLHARLQGGNMTSGAITLHMILSQMTEVYPARTLKNPDGTAWDGLALPDRVLDYSKIENWGEQDLARGNLLDIATECGATHDAIRMLVASGFDPGKFSDRVRMTPIGKAAHDGNIGALRLFAQAGYDLSMPYEHTSHEDSVSTNLLHRLMLKRDIDSPEGVEVVEVLLEAGVDPFAVHAEGWTPFEMAKGNILVAMEKWLARQQSSALEEGVGPATQEGATPKSRL